MSSQICLTIYDENDEIKAKFQRLIIPWGMLKRALKFKGLNEASIDEQTFDELAGFVCELFSNKVTRQDIESGADISEVFTVIQAVVTRAGGYFGPNV